MKFNIIGIKTLLISIKYNFIFYSKLGYSLLFKHCYIGPFYGEFGHLLAHYVPFISYLHSKKVKVYYCGLELHKPFFFDDLGGLIVKEYIGIRDFFSENKPDSNSITKPEDVFQSSKFFIKKAKYSIYPYWDLSNFNYYFFHYRFFVSRKKLTKCYKIGESHNLLDGKINIALFPRKSKLNQGGKSILNNGLDWNYDEIIADLANLPVHIYIVGHPEFTEHLKTNYENVTMHLTRDNQEILDLCNLCEVLITPHSGAVYLGAYTNTRVLVIYNGGNTIGEIDMTEEFYNSLEPKYALDFAYSYEEIRSKIVNQLYI